MIIKHPRRYLTFVFCLFILMLGLLGKVANPLLEFQQQTIIEGQWWRLLTGHVVHLGLIHTLLNLAGFLLIMSLIGELRSIKLWCFSFVAIALGTSFLMLWFNPDVKYYAGLSGVLHGLLIFGALALCHMQKWLGRMIVCLVFAKLIYEQIIPDSTLQTATLIGAQVISIAHFYGAALGLTLHLLLTTAQSLKNHFINQHTQDQL